jgi:hypothetical protein
MIYEVGNMIYDNLVFMAEADTTGVVVGAGVLIVLSGYCRGALLVGRAAAALRGPAGARSGPRAERDGGVTRHDRRGHCA